MRRSQFFIATIVLIAISMSLIVVYLYVPNELNMQQTNEDNRLINNILFIKQVFNEISDYFKINWLLPYDHRVSIYVSSNFTLKDFTVKTNIDLSDDSYINSIVLVDSNNYQIPFNIEWIDKPSRRGVLYFQINIESCEQKYYYLYYNTASKKIKFNSKKQLVNFNESNNSIWIRTNSYYAFINKSEGGSFHILNNSGGDNFLNYFNNFIKCGSSEFLLNESVNKQVNITNKYYYLKIVFSGSRFSNETYKVTELFFPDRILINDEMSIAASSNCSSWGSRININRDNMINYKDEEYTFEPTGENTALFFIGNRSWFEMYGGGFSFVLVAGNESPVYLSTTTDSSIGEFRFINGSDSFINNTYTNNITLVPLLDDNFINTKQDYNPSITLSYEVFNSKVNDLFNLLSQYFYDVNSIVTYNKSSGIIHESFTNQKDWFDNFDFRDKLMLSKQSGLKPIEADLIVKDFDPNSLIIFNHGVIPYQISTDNFLDSSSFNNSINNSLINSSLLLFNPNGDNFNITTVKESGSLTIKLFYPNGSSIINNINSSPYNLEVNGYNQSGFYNITFNGSSVFTVNSSLPKLIAKLPITLSNGSPVYLFFNESVNKTNLNITTHSDNNQVFTLFDEFNNTISSVSHSSQGTFSIDEDVIPCYSGCIYRLSVNNDGPFTINSSSIKFISTGDKFIINPFEPKIKLISVSDVNDYDVIKAYYNVSSTVNKSSYQTDINYSEQELIVNNSFFSFDFNNMRFIYKNIDWFNSRGWVTCSDSCTNSFSSVRFVEKGSERVVVWANTSVGVSYYFYFYPKIPYFKVKVNSLTNYSFGPAWSINNTDDLYYSTKGSGKLLLGDSNKFFDKFNLSGPMSFVSKSDELNDVSVIFNTNVLEDNDAVKVNDTAIILKGVSPGVFGFLINDDPDNFLNPLITSQESFIINYKIDNPSININGQLIN